ncbi:MAG TPA: 50S ribosomal protein L19 [Candidatus Paceibacterota bacterium]|nr:50S ribosomal protein L19 [Candidatus Paceibacterota bacterium]
MLSKEIIDKIKSGAQLTVVERIKEGEKERQSQFKGIVLARKHGSQKGSTFTVRAIIDGIGVEKVYPIHSPNIVSIKIHMTPNKIKKSKLYFLRDVSKKKSRQKIGVTA